ncbi:MAG: site-2 protease family protein [Xanthomonadales bacterium]|nr:site-2 protease family protein [Xanthomonadales bacterium]
MPNKPSIRSLLAAALAANASSALGVETVPRYLAEEAVVVVTDAVSGPAPAVFGGLQRQGNPGFRGSVANGALVVGRVDESSEAARAGLREGDVIEAIDGRAFSKAHIGQDLLETLKGDEPVSLRIRRDGRAVNVAFTPPPRDWEQLSGLEAEYGVLETSDGARLRTIVTRPRGADSPLPAVFMIQWVGCSSLEFQHEGPWLMVYKGVAERSGLAMIRVERSANGDSEGPPCHQLDMNTERMHYDEAFEVLTRHPWVDRDRVVLMGNSLGTKMVPLVAHGKLLAGAITSSGGGLSYFERMVNFDRHALSHEDRDPAEAHDILMAQMPFQVMYLLEGKTPEQIVAERPDLEGVWETIAHTGDGHHYGRPYAYHHQAARQDYVEAWAVLEAPILVNFNQYDQFEELRGAELIVDTVNRLRPGTATLAVHAQLGHSFRRYASQLDAYAYRDGEPGHEVALAVILDWLEQHVPLTD